MMSSGFCFSAKLTTCAAVATVSAMTKASGGAHPTPGSTFAFAVRQACTRCSLGYDFDRGIRMKIARRHHLARAAPCPERQIVALALLRTRHHADQPLETAVVRNTNTSTCWPMDRGRTQPLGPGSQGGCGKHRQTRGGPPDDVAAVSPNIDAG